MSDYLDAPYMQRRRVKEPIRVRVSDEVVRQYRENPPSEGPFPSAGLMVWLEVCERLDREDASGAICDVEVKEEDD